MKKLLFVAVSALALAGVAVAADSTQFGVLPVNAPTKRTLVAIPWVEASATTSNIAVSNLVLTSNLQVGDTLDVLNTAGTSLNRWILAEGTGGVLYWNSVTMVTEGVNKGSYASTTPAANTATIARGSAVALIRNGANRDYSPPFYVMGQVATSAPESTTISAGQGSAPCYNMIAPPSTVAQCLNHTGDVHCATWSGSINANDRIVIPTQYLNVELRYTNSCWSCASTTSTKKYYTYTKDGDTYVKTEVEEGTPGAFEVTETSTTWVPYNTGIPVGTGFWYVSYGGSPTVTWSDVPVVPAAE